MSAPKPMRVLSEIPKTDYRLLISPSDRRPLVEKFHETSLHMFAFSVRQEIPKFLLPLQSGDTEPLVDLQALLVGVMQDLRLKICQLINPLKQKLWE